MAYVITDDCIFCEACLSECPANCISRGDNKCVIDKESCVECGTCADVCPAAAIVQE